MVVVYTPVEEPWSRAGIAVSRKVGNAVVRNRVKRWMREACRHHLAELRVPQGVVLVAHPACADAGYARVAETIQNSFQRINKRS
jgi:ribonuclease P protein component